MSTEAPRRPSPADMPRRSPALKRPTTRKPATGRFTRAQYEEAVLASRLHPHHQLVALALATHATPAAAIAQQPRLIGLVHDTGLHAAQITVALTALRQRGWVRQTDREARYETADLVLTLPAAVLARLRATTTTETTDA
ncbi:hypothetical protein [Streptomyces halstedii]|uniref:hypothetical protein n=1 Tax=Streptomyces halstedii TaxID=1944 RepID=UPI00381053A2